MVDAQKIWEIVQKKASISGTWRHWRSVYTSFSEEYVLIVVHEHFWDYAVRIVVFDKPRRWGHGDLQIFQISTHWTLSGAKEKASEMESRLKNLEYNYDFPIISFLNNKEYRGADVYDMVSDEIKRTFKQSTWENNLLLSVEEADDYLRPFDIIKINRGGGFYKHVAIYLGRGYICHFAGNKMGSSGSDGLKVIKDNLSNFFQGERKRLVKIVRPIFEFKSKQKIIEDIAKAIVYEYGKYQYDTNNNNCEHFAYMIVCGISYSSQGSGLKSFASGRDKNILKEEIRECKRYLDNLVSSSDYRVRNLIEEIKELSRESDEESYGNWEARIEVNNTSLGNTWCKIQ